MKIQWSRLGGQLGIGFCVAGLFLVFLGWNGAASWDRVPSQFPYLISGGLAGLSLVVIGAALIVVQNQRADSAKLETRIGELRDAIERASMAAETRVSTAADSHATGLVVAGPSSFHSPGCRLVQGRGTLPEMRFEQAVERGLEPCRVCAPAPEAPARPPRASRRAAR